MCNFLILRTKTSHSVCSDLAYYAQLGFLFLCRYLATGKAGYVYLPGFIINCFAVQRISGPVVYVRMELAIIQFCAMVARNEFINNVVE